MKKTKLYKKIEAEQASLHRQAKRTAAKLTKEVVNLEKTINDGLLPLWMTDIQNHITDLLFIANQHNVLEKVKDEANR